MESRTETVTEALHYPIVEMPAPPLWRGLPEVGTLRDTHRISNCRTEFDGTRGNSPAESSPGDGDREGAMRSFEAGREQGIREGRDLERQEHRAAAIEHEKSRIRDAAGLVEQFAEERDRFLQAAEREIAELALSIAARILRREAQIDPLFLTGAVRVALSQLAETTKVRLHVPAAEADLWTETLAHIPNLKIRPTVIADERFHRGDCVIETELGTADLGVNAQLGEVSHVLVSSAHKCLTESAQLDGTLKASHL